MKVTLLSKTKDADRIIATAARTCVSSKDIGDIYDELTDESIEKSINNIMESGHHSVLEHASYTFGIEGVSRALLAQLTRHRIGVAFSVRSQRYVYMDDITTAELLATTCNNRHPEFQRSYTDAIRFYRDLIEQGVAKEDARMLLPNAMPTSLVMTMNAREIYHFCGLRMCTRAQFEIRTLANMICDLCKETDPKVFEKLGPHCTQLGYCPEGKRSCGKEYTIEQYKAAMANK